MLTLDVPQINEASYLAEVAAASGGQEGSSKAHLHQMIKLMAFLLLLCSLYVQYTVHCLFPFLDHVYMILYLTTILAPPPPSICIRSMMTLVLLQFNLFELLTKKAVPKSTSLFHFHPNTKSTSLCQNLQSV
jgi:hypothetical protein